MNVFGFTDYRKLMRAWVKEQPKGRGQLSRLCQTLKIETSHLSQVLSGSRELSYDLCLLTAEYFGFTELETEYFLQLGQLSRAQSAHAKSYAQKKIKELQAQGLKIVNVIPHERQLTETEKAIFYSSWHYSAVHLLSSLHAQGVSMAEVLEKLRIERNKATEVIRFLKATNLIEEKNGRYLMKTQSTYIDRSSPFLGKHHTNWRIRALDKYDSLSETELMYTAQFSIDEENFALIREKLLAFIKEFNKVATDSPSEKVANINLDLFFVSS